MALPCVSRRRCGCEGRHSSCLRSPPASFLILTRPLPAPRTRALEVGVSGRRPMLVVGTPPRGGTPARLLILLCVPTLPTLRRTHIGGPTPMRLPLERSPAGHAHIQMRCSHHFLSLSGNRTRRRGGPPPPLCGERTQRRGRRTASTYWWSSWVISSNASSELFVPAMTCSTTEGE